MEDLREHGAEKVEAAADEELAPWLHVTAMFFSGEPVEELKLGSVSPLSVTKDDARFTGL